MAIELELELITNVDTKDVDKTDDGCKPGKHKASMCGGTLRDLASHLTEESNK